ncbi:MAG: hypothetical protein ABSH20_06610 [Tepidisphaeraceae bacterium]|jgi:hypothetical protein
MSKDYPWRDGSSVTQIINANRKMLVRIGMIEEGSGYTERELKAWNARLKSPAPTEAIELYRAARARQVGEEHWPSMGLFTLEDKDVRWYDLVDERPHPIDIIWWRDQPVDPAIERGWRKAQGFMLGGTPFFDKLFILRGHGRIPDGSILLTDHESSYPMVIAARSLTEYMARLCYFAGTDLISFPGERDRLPHEKVMAFVREYVELNPESEEDWSEWAMRQATKARAGKRKSSGYMHWDQERKRLVPIAEAGEVPLIQIEHATRAQLESLAAATSLITLMVLDSVIDDAGLLAKISSLEELYVYDCGEVDASPLSRAKNLKEMCFLRCAVRGIAALAELKGLRRLRLQECSFDQDEFKAFKKARPMVKLE